MKKYVRANYENAMASCKRAAKEAADSIWDFQNMITGPMEFSEYFTAEDIEVLDNARILLTKYSDEA
jgi:hypothetical protein